MEFKGRRESSLFQKVLFDPYCIGIMFYGFIYFMYSLRLSSLYDITSEYLLYCFVLVLFLIVVFILFRSANKYSMQKLINELTIKSSKCSPRESRILVRLNFWLFLIGTAASIYVFQKVGFTAMLVNKVSRVGDASTHYLGYLQNFLVYQMATSYYLMRISCGSKRKLKYLSMFIIAGGLLYLNLNRGVYTFPLLLILLYESIRSRKNFLVIMITSIIGFITYFAYIGNLRVAFVMENVYKTTISDFYGMSGYPSWFTWLYIYLTSPLENFNNMLMQQTVSHHTFGLQVLFPFFQIIFKLFSYDLQDYTAQIFPYLAIYSGLTVSSFQQAALVDFGIIGPFVYIVIFAVFINITLRIANKSVFGLFHYAMGLNILMWGIFVNPFSIGPFMIGWLLYGFSSLLCCRFSSIEPGSETSEGSAHLQ